MARQGRGVNSTSRRRVGSSWVCWLDSSYSRRGRSAGKNILGGKLKGAWAAVKAHMVSATWGRRAPSPVRHRTSRACSARAPSPGRR